MTNTFYILLLPLFPAITNATLNIKKQFAEKVNFMPELQSDFMKNSISQSADAVMCYHVSVFSHAVHTEPVKST